MVGMIKLNWTDEQKTAIDLKDKNILISAAAGSGKTSVLVERIIDIITDTNKNIDIDHLLVVTFTKSAASEMRDKIATAIENKLLVCDSEHIQKQQALVHSAQITTIHSFCLNVIRNNFNMIDIDPSFRVADETELELLKSDIISDLLEKHYNENEENFCEFIESYSTGKNDFAIENLILQLYNFSQSYPYPYQWLNSLRDTFEIVTAEDLENMKWIKFLIEYIHEIATGLENIVSQAIEICSYSDGPYMYLEALYQDRILISNIKNSKSYCELSKFLCGYSWSRLSSKKDENVSIDMRDFVKEFRKEIKTTIDNIKKSYFFQLPEYMADDIRNSKSVMNVLIDLTIEFSDEYSENKMSKNILDFSDLEHKALDILLKKDNNGVYTKTAVAQDLTQYYQQIMIDEYQDINSVQELILNSVSHQNSESPNLFMVGDVKQSIYKFRLAKPEIFMEKYLNYPVDGNSNQQRVDLSQNFRSRAEILDFVNFIFSQIMDSKLGGIDYDDKAALYLGSEYPTAENLNTEIIALNLTDENDSDILDQIDYTSKEIEAKAVANRINDMFKSGFKVCSKDRNSYRDLKYSDIVILLRTVSGWSEVFEDILMQEGIPTHCDTSTGYFSTIEIQTILSMLAIIDNPIQDIPFTAVLKSPIASVTSQELAVIKSEFKNKSMYDSVAEYIENGSQSEIRQKLLDFKQLLDRFRDCTPYTDVHELILKVLDETDYYTYVSAMPAGEKRKANIDMLVEKAVQFETTSYRGLFNFIRYIEKIKQYDIDFGEANIFGEDENAVRIMSIHKSKGLEFPVVFVSGMGKQFNNQDARSKIVIHSDLGIGSDFIDYNLRTKSTTLVKKIISKRIYLENLEEELRILYVAFTRAKEKLIITGSVKDFQKVAKKLNTIPYSSERLPFNTLSSAISYFDWLFPAIARHISFNSISDKYNIHVGSLYSKYSDVNFDIKIINVNELVNQEIKVRMQKRDLKQELIQWNTDRVFDLNVHQNISDILNWKYKYENDVNLHSKMTVSELKFLGQDIFSQDSQKLIDDNTVVNIPKFLNESADTIGVSRGTVIHKVMQNLDFVSINTVEDVETQIHSLIELNRLDEEAEKIVDLEQIYRFATSSLAKRMIAAKDRLYREKQFIIGIRANEIDRQFKSNEFILIQGIIDVYFEEDNQIVLVDYKSDRVYSPQLLIQKYRTQLEYYQKALEQITDKKVKEKIIYSFSMSKEIYL